MKKILAVIPARSGSKSVPHKNIREINKKPMLAYSIEHAEKSKYINRIILDTDSLQYAEIGKKYGAEIPFIRPEQYATDTATDLDVFYHCLTFLKEKEDYIPDIVVQLRPTYPIRDIKDIDAMIELLLEEKEADSVRSIAPAKEIAYKMWKKGKDKYIEPILTDVKEGYNLPRQQLPVIYYQNACIDVTRGNTILKQHSMTGKRILGYEMKHNYDIDTEEEFKKAELFLSVQAGTKRFVIDIDGVIAKFEPNLDYEDAQPNMEMIETINRLYEMGNHIVVFTARGYVTGKDWSKTTKEQFIRWGLKYHELIFGKPNADYYIDDKNLDMSQLINLFHR